MNGYTLLKLVHIIAVIIFLGNIFTGLFWMSLATKTRNVQIISHTMQGIIKSDRWFTVPGVLIITAGGILAAIYGHIPILRTGWIFWAIVLFSVSGIVFAWKVAPLQQKIFKLTQTGIIMVDEKFWKEYNKLNMKWELWGAIALITPIMALCMMVLKIPTSTILFK